MEDDIGQPSNVTIPPHLIAEAMQAMRGEENLHLDRRSAPISAEELKYVDQYVKARYPEIYMERVVGMNLPQVIEEGEDSDQPSLGGSPSVRDSMERQRQPSDQNRRPVRGNSLPQQGGNHCWRSAPSGASLAEEETGKAQLDPSRLAEIMGDNTVSSMDNATSVTEIHARNHVLQRCGVNQAEYHVVFTGSAQEALMLVAEAYPFHKHNVYMTALDESRDSISQYAALKESKVILAPITWLDLGIAGSQLSTTFRRKSESNPKGLFAFPVLAGGLRNSLHWVSEAHRNLWHVLLDASDVSLDADSFDLGNHQPDYIVCVSPKTVGYPTRVTCLLIRRSSHGPGLMEHIFDIPRRLSHRRETMKVQAVRVSPMVYPTVFFFPTNGSSSNERIEKRSVWTVTCNGRSRNALRGGVKQCMYQFCDTPTTDIRVMYQHPYSKAVVDLVFANADSLLPPEFFSHPALPIFVSKISRGNSSAGPSYAGPSYADRLNDWKGFAKGVATLPGIIAFKPLFRDDSLSTPEKIAASVLLAFTIFANGMDYGLLGLKPSSSIGKLLFRGGGVLTIAVTCAILIANSKTV